MTQSEGLPVPGFRVDEPEDFDVPDDPMQIDPPCHRCGSRHGWGGYGRAGGVLGTYVHCAECEALLELSPDNEGLTEEQARRCDEAAAKKLAFSRLPGRQRWLVARRERRRTAYKRRKLRRDIDRITAEMFEGRHEKRDRRRGPIHVTTLTTTEWL